MPRFSQYQRQGLPAWKWRFDLWLRLVILFALVVTALAFPLAAARAQRSISNTETAETRREQGRFETGDPVSSSGRHRPGRRVVTHSPIQS
jgi:hypothetical protein